MKKEQYDRMAKPFRENLLLKRILIYGNKIGTLAVYAAYPVVVWNGYKQGFGRLLETILIPGICFVLLSLFRDCYNAKRPYELLEIEPIISKDTKGHSFPSRHVFSAFIISMAIYSMSTKIGVIYFVISCMIGICRVIGGVHFPKDVIAGGAIGIFGWLIGLKLMWICQTLLL